MASPTLVSLLSLPPSIEALGPANVHLLGLAMLLVLLLVLSSRLAAIHALLAPQDARKQSVLDLPSMLIRKGALVAYGAYFSLPAHTPRNLAIALSFALAAAPVCLLSCCCAACSRSCCWCCKTD